MSVATESSKKWIQTSVAITCIVLGYILISFFQTLSEWFELESKIASFNAISQVIAVLISLGVFVAIMKNPLSSQFLQDVFAEMTKVVWPDKNETVKHTIVIMIGVSIVGTFLAVFDISAAWLLSLIS